MFTAEYVEAKSKGDTSLWHWYVQNLGSKVSELPKSVTLRKVILWNVHILLNDKHESCKFCRRIGKKPQVTYAF